jgi:hypothetical protein
MRTVEGTEAALEKALTPEKGKVARLKKISSEAHFYQKNIKLTSNFLVMPVQCTAPRADFVGYGGGGIHMAYTWRQGRIGCT